MSKPSDNPADPFKKVLAEATKTLANDPELSLASASPSKNGLRPDLRPQPIDAGLRNKVIQILKRVSHFKENGQISDKDFETLKELVGDPDIERRGVNYWRAAGSAGEKADFLLQERGNIYVEDLSHDERIDIVHRIQNASTDNELFYFLDLFEANVMKLQAHDFFFISALTPEIQEWLDRIGRDFDKNQPTAEEIVAEAMREDNVA